MTRAVSTTVDVAVFLLVVSAATLTVAMVQPPRHADGDAADDVAFVVATATATVEYESRSHPDDRSPDTPPRTAHGTVAGLLADAAFATATVDGRPLTPGGAGFERAVRAEARERLPDEGVQVVATWRPVPGAPVAGRTAVGPSPPPDADVAAATLAVSVPGGPANVDHRTFRGVASAVARAVVRGRFPPAATGPELRPETRLRYRRAAGVLGADVAGPLRRGDAAAANRRLAAALTPRVADGLRRRYDDPETAARAVSVGRVRVTVRRWSP